MCIHVILLGQGPWVVRILRAKSANEQYNDTKVMIGEKLRSPDAFFESRPMKQGEEGLDVAEVQVDERDHEILLREVMGRWLLLEKGAFPWLGCPEWDATPVGVE